MREGFCRLGGYLVLIMGDRLIYKIYGLNVLILDFICWMEWVRSCISIF